MRDWERRNPRYRTHDAAVAFAFDGRRCDVNGTADGQSLAIFDAEVR